ncbi:hypothetical protein DS831_03420 [Bombilactobacillus bombi]|uniref:XRE family transcriptional regulator n=1 Tax=Bombilactobacillus bombi TaxID=1303590 RepID=A0A417ZKB6_9LACO|nr:helix-turn-helix transcriptional regulator [Bombilactobacillus bombi]RHW52387.1 hypothetical protein DS831_03420 [Bombilactobacillus bombi]
MTINQLLCKERKKQHLSVRKLAEIIQIKYDYFVSKSTLNYIEQPGKGIDAKLLFILIDYYQLDIVKIQNIFLAEKNKKNSHKE